MEANEARILVTELQRLRTDRDSWRRVAETLEAENARLKQPVSDEEWEMFGYTVTTDASTGPVSKYSLDNSTVHYCTKLDFNKLLASRSKEQAQKGDAN